MIIKYSDNNENRIEWRHREGEEWRTAELDELIKAYEREKTGKWIGMYADDKLFCAYCSVCNEVTVAAYNFCPNCGARMFDEDTNVLGKDGREEG